MPIPRVLILRAPGTNCDLETQHAFELAGGRCERWHINQLLASPQALQQFEILCLPGGFSYGDDIAAGRILGNQLRHGLADTVRAFKAANKLVLGICNGFQILLKSGVLLDRDPPPATLTWNDSGRFEARWVRLETTATPGVFFTGIKSMYLPVAHAEGKFVAPDQGAFEACGQVALRYVRLAGDAGPGGVPYPENPNGSQADIAGICDTTGRVCGLMPHPERHVERTQHPRWTRGEGTEPGDGLQVFKNGVAWFR